MPMGAIPWGDPHTHHAMSQAAPAAKGFFGSLVALVRSFFARG